jgi:hypothetical protein
MVIVITINDRVRIEYFIPMSTVLQLFFNDIIGGPVCVLTDTSVLRLTERTRQTLFFISLQKAVFYPKIYSSQENWLSRDHCSSHRTIITTCERVAR